MPIRGVATRGEAWRLKNGQDQSPRDGKFLEILGWYDPRKTADKFGLNLDRIAYWTSQGAQVSETVASLVKQAKKAAAAAPVEA